MLSLLFRRKIFRSLATLMSLSTLSLFVLSFSSYGSGTDYFNDFQSFTVKFNGNTDIVGIRIAPNQKLERRYCGNETCMVKALMRPFDEEKRYAYIIDMALDKFFSDYQAVQYPHANKGHFSTQIESDYTKGKVSSVTLVIPRDMELIPLQGSIYKRTIFWKPDETADVVEGQMYDREYINADYVDGVTLIVTSNPKSEAVLGDIYFYGQDVFIGEFFQVPEGTEGSTKKFERSIATDGFKANFEMLRPVTEKLKIIHRGEVWQTLDYPNEAKNKALMKEVDRLLDRQEISCEKGPGDDDLVITASDPVHEHLQEIKLR